MTVFSGVYPEVAYITHCLRKKEEEQFCSVNSYMEVSKPARSPSVHYNAMHGDGCE